MNVKEQITELGGIRITGPAMAGKTTRLIEIAKQYASIGWKVALCSTDTREYLLQDLPPCFDVIEVWTAQDLGRVLDHGNYVMVLADDIMNLDFGFEELSVIQLMDMEKLAVSNNITFIYSIQTRPQPTGCISISAGASYEQ